MHTVSSLRTQLKSTGSLHERLLAFYDQLEDLEQWLDGQDQDGAGIAGALDLVDGAKSMLRDQVRELNKTIANIHLNIDKALEGRQ